MYRFHDFCNLEVQGHVLHLPLIETHRNVLSMQCCGVCILFVFFIYLGKTRWHLCIKVLGIATTVLGIATTVSYVYFLFACLCVCMYMCVCVCVHVCD